MECVIIAHQLFLCGFALSPDTMKLDRLMKYESIITFTLTSESPQTDDKVIKDKNSWCTSKLIVYETDHLSTYILVFD